MRSILLVAALVCVCTSFSFAQNDEKTIEALEKGYESCAPLLSGIKVLSVDMTMACLGVLPDDKVHKCARITLKNICSVDIQVDLFIEETWGYKTEGNKTVWYNIGRMKKADSRVLRPGDEMIGLGYYSNGNYRVEASIPASAQKKISDFKAKEARYNAAMQAAQGYENTNDYKNAISQYRTAAQLKPAKAGEINARIASLEEKQKKAGEKEKAAKNTNGNSAGAGLSQSKPTSNAGSGNNGSHTATPDEQYNTATAKYQNAMKNGDYETAQKELDKANSIKPVQNYRQVRESMEILGKAKHNNEQAKKDLEKNTQEFANNLATTLSGVREPDGNFVSLSAGSLVGSKASLAFNFLWHHFMVSFGASYRRSPAYTCVNYNYRYYQSAGGIDGRLVPTDTGTIKLDVYTGDVGIGYKWNLSKNMYLLTSANAYLGGTSPGSMVYGLYPSVALIKRNLIGHSDMGISFDFLISDKRADLSPPVSPDDHISSYPGDVTFRNYMVLSLYFVPGILKMEESK